MMAAWGVEAAAATIRNHEADVERAKHVQRADPPAPSPPTTVGSTREVYDLSHRLDYSQRLGEWQAPTWLPIRPAWPPAILPPGHFSCAFQQRAWNWQPRGGSSGTDVSGEHDPFARSCDSGSGTGSAQQRLGVGMRRRS